MWWNRGGPEAGRRGHGAHIRSSFATHMLTDRDELRTVQDVLGHSYVRATMIDPTY